MITEHKKIFSQDKLIFENISTDAPHSFSYPMIEEACFIYIKQGENFAFTQDEMIQVPEGHLAFANSGNLIFKSAPNEDSGEFQALIIHIPKAWVLEALTEKFSSLDPRDPKEVSRDIVTGKPCVIIGNYIDGIRQYFDNPHIVNQDLIKLKVNELLLLLLQSKRSEQVSRLLENFVNHQTLGFKNIIESHVFNDVSLDELAHLCNMSLSTFKRHFKKVYQATPSDYIFDRRLERSKKLLATSEYSVLDVALISGFKTMSHYSKKFKEKFGIPPSQYKMTLSGK